MTFRKPDYLLLIILFTGTLLRFYGFPHIPFMYDEISAWARTGFSNFHELIEKGVRGDGHPAGIQVFLNYLRMVAGDSEASFKLPFLLMGIASIWVVFLIAKTWFNATVGYISSGFVAVLQYMIMYSQIARPYVSGLFFSLMMVWCWSNFLFNEPQKNNKTLNLFGYIIFAALCSYNHYFSLLFAFVTGITGLIFLNKRNRVQYLVACLIIVILFLPHLQLTLHQLSLGGVGGWLSKPTRHFFPSYVSYIFHFSLVFLIVTPLIVVLGFFFRDPQWPRKNKFRMICSAWFMFPFLIGYFYSVYRNAVLQYSVLIFSFPYFLILIFSFWKNVKHVYNVVLVTIVIGFGIYTLIVNRMHYRLFYHQPIEQLVADAIDEKQKSPQQNSVILMNLPRKYAGYYLNKFHADLPAIYWPEWTNVTYRSLQHFLDSCHAEEVITGNIPNDYVLLIRQQYPFMIKRDVGFTYSFYCFSKESVNEWRVNDIVFSDSLDLRLHKSENWTYDQNNIQMDSSTGEMVYHMESDSEFGPTFSMPVKQIATSWYNVVNITVRLQDVQPQSDMSLVFNLEDDKKEIFWQEKSVNIFRDDASSHVTMLYSMSLRDVWDNKTDVRLKTYCWNKSKDSFDIASMKVELQEGNPYIYGLIEKIPGNQY